MNQPDSPMNPLDQLKDLHLPPPPGWWPPAPGWWLVALLIVSLVVAGALVWRKRRRANLYRRLALAELQEIAAHSDNPQFLPDLIALLRRTARAANSASEWIGLGAPQLLAQLEQFSAGKNARLDPAHSDIADLAASQYRSQPTAPNLHQQTHLVNLAKHWIRKHRSGL